MQSLRLDRGPERTGSPLTTTHRGRASACPGAGLADELVAADACSDDQDRRLSGYESGTHRCNRVHRISRTDRTARARPRGDGACPRRRPGGRSSPPAAPRRPWSTSTTGRRSRACSSDADGAIHTASPGDATSADLDSAVADAVIDAFAGTGKPYLQISGLWIYGANRSITEESPFDAPALVAWKVADRTPGARRDRHARSRDRLQYRLRGRRGRDSRAASRFPPRRRRAT